MLFILTRLQTILRQGIINKTTTTRYLSRGATLLNEEEVEVEAKSAEPVIDPAKDRRNPVSPETSIRYLTSEAYKETYGKDLVWKPYRRNFKGQIPPKKTRKTCVRNGIVTTGNPCPICRDEYLILDYRNIALLKQFISEYNGAILNWQVTNICQRQHKALLVAVHKAKMFGLLTFDVPFRTYDYSDWYKPEEKTV